MTLKVEVIPHRPSYLILDNQAGVAVTLPVSFTGTQSEIYKVINHILITDLLLRGKILSGA